MKTITTLIFSAFLTIQAAGQCNDTILTGAALPVPINKANKNNPSLLSYNLNRIKTELPKTDNIFVVFADQQTDSTDWLPFLDSIGSYGFKAVVAFYDVINDEALKPRPDTPFVFNTSDWILGSIKDFIQCNSCIAHPALYAVSMVDEPFEYMNTPFLHDLYKTCKNLNQSFQYNIMVNHSRQIWKKMHTSQGGLGTNPQKYWRDSLCDIVNISTLEFTKGMYDYNTLNSNHTVSRQIINSITPNLPLFTTVQTFGNTYGLADTTKENNFPTGANLLQMLNDITSPAYQNIKPLTGIFFQSWSSKTSTMNDWTLGDEQTIGTPMTQVQAAQNLIDTINYWIDSCAIVTSIAPNTEASLSLLKIYPNPSQSIINLEISDLTLTKSALVKIYNSQGTLVYQSSFKSTIDITDLPTGLYFIKIFPENKTISLTSKFVKTE